MDYMNRAVRKAIKICHSFTSRGAQFLLIMWFYNEDRSDLLSLYVLNDCLAFTCSVLYPSFSQRNGLLFVSLHRLNTSSYTRSL